MAIVSAFSPSVYAGNINWDKDRREGKAGFENTRGWATAFELLKVLYETGNTKTAFDTDYNTACAMFANSDINNYKGFVNIDLKPYQVCILSL